MRFTARVLLAGAGILVLLLMGAPPEASAHPISTTAVLLDI